MKLIRWVEVHIGRSRRKNKKESDASTRWTEESREPRSAEPTPLHRRHPPSPHPRLRVPETPPGSRRLNIRTSFLESPGTRHQQVASSATKLADSPKVRCRIKTNPWLPSPKNSATSVECRRPSSIGSESSESISCSGFGSQSSGSLWEGLTGESWGGHLANGRSPTYRRLPRVTLERPTHRQRPVVKTDRLSLYDEDTPYCPITYCRPIPRSAWMNFREFNKDIWEKTTILPDDQGESSDEAYSEDYIHLEEQDELSLDIIRSSKHSPPDTGSPQADSACGSDRDNSSCSTTPLSETPASSTKSRKSLKESKEMLQDKVQRLKRERHLVDIRMKEARVEEILRREERLLLQRELVQFRRLLLIQTLSNLRSELEKRRDSQCARKLNGVGENNVNMTDDEETWLQVETDLLE